MKMKSLLIEMLCTQEPDGHYCIMYKLVTKLANTFNVLCVG